MSDQAEREAFEAWAGPEFIAYGIDSDDGHYADVRVRAAWRAWQAARELSAGARRDAERYRAMMQHDLTAKYSDLWFAKLNYNGDELREAEDNWSTALDAGRGKV